MTTPLQSTNDRDDFLKGRLEVLEQTQRAMLNILEDFGGEREKYRDIQRATMNLLEDFDNERRRYREVQTATMNLLEGMDEERRRADQVKTALMNMLEDIESERVKGEQSRARLEYVNRELEAFSYSVSHDLRAPLRAWTVRASVVGLEYGLPADRIGFNGQTVRLQHPRIALPTGSLEWQAGWQYDLLDSPPAAYGLKAVAAEYATGQTPHTRSTPSVPQCSDTSPKPASPERPVLLRSSTAEGGEARGQLHA